MDMLERLRNLETFAGILAMDKWTGNANGRQAAFWRKVREQKYTVAFIDQGYCFNAGEWTFPDYPLRGVYARNEVYDSVRGWESFEPWLSRIEGMGDDRIWKPRARFRRSGTTMSGLRWRPWCRCCWSGERWCGS